MSGTGTTRMVADSVRRRQSDTNWYPVRLVCLLPETQGVSSLRPDLATPARCVGFIGALPDPRGGPTAARPVDANGGASFNAASRPAPNARISSRAAVAAPLRASSHATGSWGRSARYAQHAVAPVLPGQPPQLRCTGNRPGQGVPGLGYRFLEDSLPAHTFPERPREPPARSCSRVDCRAVVAVGSTASLVTRDAQEASGARLDSRSAAHRTPASLDVLASHPLSTRAAERQLERGSLRGATTTALPHAARRFDPGQRTPSGAAASATPAAP